MPLILVLIGLIAFSQEVELNAPWLTVYDPEGNPRWEVSLGRLYKTDSGWEGEGVEVRLYWKGELQITLRADRLTADRLGRNWTLSGEVSGQAGELRISCRQADWGKGLTLTELAAEGEGLSLSAARASWEEGSEVSLTEVRVKSHGWSLELAIAIYQLDSGYLTGQGAEIAGHGYLIQAEGLELHPEQGELILKGAHLVPGA